MTVKRKCPKCGNEYPIKPYRKYCPGCKGVLYLKEMDKGICLDAERHLRR